MAGASTSLASTPALSARPRLGRRLWPALLLLAIVLSIALRGTFPALQHYPRSLIIPLQGWIDQFFNWLAYSLSFGAFTFHDLTRAIASAAGWLLDLAAIVFVDGLPGQGVPALPWLTTTVAVGVLGHYAGGRRVALIGAIGFAYLAVFGMWHAAMQTFALVIVTVPVAALIGLALGILAARRPVAERVIVPVFNVMQATPHFSYLVPVIMLFGFGQVPGMMAAAIFAVPPMAHNVLLALRSVPANVVESARMAGCTSRQLLWKVEVPSGRQIIMLGVNQVIMMTLAMVVIASLIGATGLGYDLLNSLQNLHVGRALQEGIAIVVIAVVLDQISQAYARKAYVHRDPGQPFASRHPHLVWGGGLILASLAVAALVPAARVLPDELTVTTAPFWQAVIDYITLHFHDFFMALQDFVLLNLLIPFRDALMWLPYPALIGAVMLGAYCLGGWRLLAPVTVMSLLPVVTGLWEPAMLTLYMISTAVIVCLIVGFPIGVAASRHDRLAGVLMILCDTLQTFPSFIYLIPVIMVFKVGNVAAITAVVIYAIVPIIRYTNLGLRAVPVDIVEAARTIGCTRNQLLWKVQIPVALPEIMLGVNQTVMMGLFMVAITALIGTRDLGQEINRALSNGEPGEALVAGLCIAAMGLITDRFIRTWAERRKQQLGLA